MNSGSVRSEMQTSVLGPQFVVRPSGPAKVPGRKRGRPPASRKLDFQSHYVEVKVPKKRGRKPGFKVKPRMLTSPPSSTPEPELGSVPQDAAIVPHSASPEVLTAETPMGDHFLFEPAAINPADSAFSVVTSQHHTRYGYRGNGCFQDGNRNGYSPMPDSGESRRPGRDPSSWNVDDVVWFIRDADPQALGPHAEAFRKHEIDGGALLLLKSETMMKYLGLKLGPALKLCFHIDRLKQNRL